MQKFLKIFLTFLTVNYSLLSYHPVYAQITNPTAPKFSNPFGLAQLIAVLWKTAFLVGGIVTLVYIFLGGLTWITSGGDKAGSEKAKSMITDAVIGIVVLAGYF